MNALALRFKDLQKKGEKVLLPFITAGDPDLQTTGALMAALAENGADVIELGLPFSDPLADGPVLQAAAERALAAKVTPAGVFELVKRFSNDYDTPVVLLVYYNMILRPGVENFCRRAKEAGITGLVVPDLPLEEATVLDAAAADNGLLNIRFISPTTTEERLQKICRSAAGFIYCVAVTGVTGERDALDEHITDLLARARKYTDVPLALGFGISGSGQAAAAARLADAVIVGSALVQRISAAEGMEEKIRAAAEFVGLLKSSILEAN